MGYVGAQRLLDPGLPSRVTTSSPPGCRNTTTIRMRRRSTGWRCPAARPARPSHAGQLRRQAPPSPDLRRRRTMTRRRRLARRRAPDAAAGHGRRRRLQCRLRPARPQVDGRPAGPAGSRAVARPHGHPCPGSRNAARRAGAGRGRHAARRQLERRHVGFHARQHGRGRAPFRAGGRCLARPGLVVDAVGRFVLGGPRQPAGRQSAEVRALSQARRDARPHLLRPDRAEGARHEDRTGLERAAARPHAGPTCCATTAPAAARWRCCSSARQPRRRELFTGSIDADPQYVETAMALA